MPLLYRFNELAFGVCSFALILTATAHAETKPHVSITTRAATIAVTVDAALRKHPGLFENCLAEGRRWAEHNRAEAAGELKDNPEFFAEGRRWTFERRYEIRSVIGRYVSVLRDDGTYQGGAHPNSYTDTILWDREGRRRMNVRPFFRETADNGPTMNTLARLARLAVAAEKIKIDAILVDVPKEKLTPERLAELDHFIRDGIEPSLLKLGPITFAPSTESGKSSGLTFHYSPYAVGAYAEGPYTVFVPWAAFKAHLSSQGVALFGGTRPESDTIP
jgi:Protein of unknown function (DUF3298)